MKTTLLIIFAITLISSCTYRMKSIKESNSMVTIPIDVDREPVKNVSEFIDRIEIVPLETDTNCIIGMCKKYFYRKELNMYFIFDKENILHLFSRDGKFISSSKSVIGQGAREYWIVTDVTYNPYSKAIEFLGPYGIIYRYDTSFKFIGNTSLNQNELIFNNFMPLSNNQYVFTPNIYSSLYFCDYEQQKVYMPPADYSEDDCPGFSFNQDRFFFDKDQLCFDSRGYCFFKVNILNRTLERYMKLDFGKNEVKKQTLDNMFGKTQTDFTNKKNERFDLDIKNKKSDYLVESDYPLPIIKLYNEKYVYIYIQRNLKRITYIYNRETEQAFLQTETSSLKLYPCLILEDNILMAPVYAHELEKYVDKELMSESEKQKMEALNEEDNPVVVKYYLK